MRRVGILNETNTSQIVHDSPFEKTFVKANLLFPEFYAAPPGVPHQSVQSHVPRDRKGSWADVAAVRVPPG